jgi:hypothetical protein
MECLTLTNTVDYYIDFITALKTLQIKTQKLKLNRKLF